MILLLPGVFLEMCKNEIKTAIMEQTKTTIINEKPAVLNVFNLKKTRTTFGKEQSSEEKCEKLEQGQQQ